MPTSKALLSAFIVVACSCADNNSENAANSTTADTSAITQGQAKDTTATAPKLIVDDYPVTDSMFARQNVDQSSSLKKRSGSTWSVDKAWFRNDSLKQALVFELYTDGHRLATYHFYAHNVPADLIHRIELHTKDGDTVTAKQKQQDFPGFVKQATTINASYFTTHKGIQLGDPQQKAIALYGAAHKQTINNGYEVLEWNYIGDILFDQKKDAGQPVALDSYGHQVIMYFKDNKLAAQILHNDIP